MALENARFDESPSPSAPDSMSPVELYNAAAVLAGAGNFDEADRHLAILLALDSDDAEAHLLRAKIAVGRERWPDALSALNRAAALGARAPNELRARIEDQIAAGRATDDERRAAVQAREDGELMALRQEARRLRSENARLVGRVHDLSGEVRRWAWLTSGVSAAAALFIVVNLALSGGPPSANAPVATGHTADGAAPSASADAPAPASPSAAPPAAPSAAAVASPAGQSAAAPAAPAAPPAASALAQQAQAALNTAAGLDGSTLTLTVQSGKAALTGSVETAVQRRRVEEIVGGVPGIIKVDATKVKILARTKGTKHTVVSGDSLSKIARDYYGDASLAGRIVAANPKPLAGKTDLKLGMVLKVPAVD
jgi:nucleoid-associated protein YgaU